MFLLADNLREYRDQKKDLEAQIKELNESIEKAEQQLVEAMIGEEMQNFTRNGRMFVLTVKTHAGAKAGMMPLICEWMKQNDLESMVKEQVHPQTLQAWVKEQIEEQGALDQGLSEFINIFEKTGITIRKK